MPSSTSSSGTVGHITLGDIIDPFSDEDIGTPIQTHPVGHASTLSSQTLVVLLLSACGDSQDHQTSHTSQVLGRYNLRYRATRSLQHSYNQSQSQSTQLMRSASLPTHTQASDPTHTQISVECESDATQNTSENNVS